MKKIIATLGLAAMCLLFAVSAFAGDIVSFNKASVDEIMAIEDVDIPEDLAKAIVDYRMAHGDYYKSAEDMLKVPGMTQDFMEELNPQVTKDGDVVHDPAAEPALAPSKC